MPQPVNLDSLTSQKGVLSSSDLRTVIANYQDPPNIANQYRFVLRVNDEPIGVVFVNDDSFTDGRYVRQALIENSSNIRYHDTVNVEMQCIDKPIYEYWNTLNQQQANGPGGGTTPANPPSNFNNGVLGYFSAHTTQSKTIIVN
jgi:hypothetical protein